MSSFKFITALILGLLISPYAQASELSEVYRRHAQPLHSYDDLDPLIDHVGTSSIVMLGEGTHGSHEFQTLRAEISKELIERKKFNYIAVEGDWSSIAKLDDYITGKNGSAKSARAALLMQNRWPRSLWANQEFEAFSEWLHDYNLKLEPDKRIHIYGIDLYAPWEAIDEVLAYYKIHHPDKLADIAKAYKKFNRFRNYPYFYGHVTPFGLSGRHGVEEIYQNIQKLDDNTPEFICAKQAAFVVMSAEDFYRNLWRGQTYIWNRRSMHMMNTLRVVHKSYGLSAKGIVWGHNSHVGDARAAPSMVQNKEINIGQLAREAFGDDDVSIIGSTTSYGDVIAAERWEGPRKIVRLGKSHPTSIESVLEEMTIGNAFVIFPLKNIPEALLQPIDQRGVGVVYNPSNDTKQYVRIIPAKHYNALVYIKDTTPLKPIHKTEQGSVWFLMQDLVYGFLVYTLWFCGVTGALMGIFVLLKRYKTR